MNRVVGSQFDPSHGSAEPHEPPVSRAINALRSESHSPTLPQKVASGKRAYSDEVRKSLCGGTRHGHARLRLRTTRFEVFSTPPVIGCQLEGLDILRLDARPIMLVEAQELRHIHPRDARAFGDLQQVLVIVMQRVQHLRRNKGARAAIPAYRNAWRELYTQSCCSQEPVIKRCSETANSNTRGP